MATRRSRSRTADVPAWFPASPVTSEGLSGDFLEACDCEVLCPCWVGRPPDQNVCNGLFAWRVRSGGLSWDGGEASLAGLRVVSVSHHEGLRGTSGVQRVAIFVDDRELDPHLDVDGLTAVLRVFLGKAGGALAGLGALLGSVVNLPDMASSTPAGLHVLRDAVVREIDIVPEQAAMADVVVSRGGAHEPDAQVTGSSVLPSEGDGPPIRIGPSSLSRSLGDASVAVADRLNIFTRDLVHGGWLDLDLHGRSSTVGEFTYAAW